MRIALVAALADNRVIGRKNSLPWHLPDDLKRFRALTVGHCVLMGHRTYASIGRPLPERANIVLSRNPGTSHEGVHVSLDLDAGLAVAREGGHESVFVIGGETVYAAAGHPYCVFATSVAELARITGAEIEEGIGTAG